MRVKEFMRRYLQKYGIKMALEWLFCIAAGGILGVCLRTEPMWGTACWLGVADLLLQVQRAGRRFREEQEDDASGV